MKQTLETIIKNIVENQDAVSIVESQEAERITFKVKVSTEDMGRVIGKQGKVANSIRTVMKALAAREKKKVTIEFQD